MLWRLSNLQRVAFCGRFPVKSSGEVQVRRTGDAVGYAGLQSCGSVWADPVCNSRIQARRRLEVGVGLSSALQGGSAAFGAYTLRHRLGEPLDPLWRALSACWQAVARDKSVRECRADLGHLGVIRAAEVTHGDHGWHPHLHPCHVFGCVVSEADVAQLHAVQWRAWAAAAERLGRSAPLLAAQHLHRVVDLGDALSDYFAKGTYAGVESVGWEITSTQTKSGIRAKGATPWDLLRRVQRDGDADALDLWHHWERGSRGKRALTWSRGLRRQLGLDAETSDEDIAAEAIGTADDVGLVVTDWTPVREDPRLGGRLLSVVATAGWDAGATFATDHAIPHRRT